MLTTIDLATPEDAMRMAEIHSAAICDVKGSFYSDEVIELWAGMDLTETANQISAAIADDDIVVIAAKCAAVIAGYGMVALSRNYVGAIYIEPSMKQKKIGSQILGKLEDAARDFGLAYLVLEASLNSESFYLKHGYRGIGSGSHKLRSGVSMACIKMKKAL